MPDILETAFESKIITRAEDYLGNNQDIKKILQDFFNQAGEGTKLAIKGVTTIASNLSIEDVIDVIQNYSTISGIFYINTDNTEETDAKDIAEKINAIAQSLLTANKCPVFSVANAVLGENNSTDLKGLGFDRSAICIGNYKENNNIGRSVIGSLAGRLAKNNIQEKASRVKDGAFTAAELIMPNADEITTTVSDEFFTKGYIVPRTITGKTGWYFADDLMCVADASDYRFITWRRTIDKAFRVAYSTLVNHLNEEIPVTSEGFIVPAIAAAWEQEIVSALYNTMTVNNQLSIDQTDASDKGCKASIPWQQNILANGMVKGTIKVKPYGYAQYVNIELGFLVEN